MVISLVVSQKAVQQPEEQPLLRPRLFRVKGRGDSAVGLLVEEEERAPGAGFLGSTREAAFTPHLHRQLQLF